MERTPEDIIREEDETLGPCKLCGLSKSLHEDDVDLTLHWPFHEYERW